MTICDISLWWYDAIVTLLCLIGSCTCALICSCQGAYTLTQVTLVTKWFTLMVMQCHSDPTLSELILHLCFDLPMPKCSYSPFACIPNSFLGTHDVHVRVPLDCITLLMLCSGKLCTQSVAIFRVVWGDTDPLFWHSGMWIYFMKDFMIQFCAWMCY